MPGHREIITISSASPTFSADLQSLKDKLQAQKQVNLVLNDFSDMTGFIRWLESIPIKSLGKISLPLSINQLKENSLTSLFNTLKNKQVEVVELDFGKELDKHAEIIEKGLTDNVVPVVDFPIQIKGKILEKFQNALIQAIQKSPKKATSSQDDIHVPESESELLDKKGKKIRLKTLVQSPAKISKQEYSQFVSVDVEHVDVVEQNVQVQEEIQVSQIVEQQITPYTGELVDFDRFNSDTYRSRALKHFTQDQVDKAYELVRLELFANLPFSAKYLTPVAAQNLASNLPQWVALNKKNCFPFVLKKKPLGEYFLDYELDEENDKEQPFALQEFHPNDDPKPYFQIKLAPPNQEVAETLFHDKANNYQNLSNLWVCYGDKGLKNFTAKLRGLDNKHPGLSKFVYDHYLAHFNHLEPFYNDVFFETLGKLENYSALQINCLKRFLVNTGSSQHNLTKTLEEFDSFWHKFKKLCKDNDELLKGLDTDWITPKGGQPVVYMERLLTILEKARSLPDQLKSLSGIELNQYGAYYASRYEGFTEVHPGMGFVYNPLAAFNSQQFNPNFTLYKVDLDKLYSEAIKSAQMYLDGRATYSDLWVIKSQIKNYGRLTRDEVEHLNISQLNKISYTEYMECNNESSPDYALYCTDSQDESRVKAIPYEGKRALPLNVYTYTQLVHRFIGQQLTGITAQAFANEYALIRTNKQYTTMTRTPVPGADFRLLHLNMGGMITRIGFRCSFQLNMLEALFFVISDRYESRVDVLVDNYRTNQNIFTALMDANDGFDTEVTLNRIKHLNRIFQNHINFSSQEAFYFQLIQNVSDLCLKLSDKQKEQFFWERVKQVQPFATRHPYISPNNYNQLWRTEAAKELQNHLFQHSIKNKYAVFKLLNLIGPHYLKSQGVILYAFNTEAFFAEMPQVAQVFSDDLLAFSAQLVNEQLNLIRSDFQEALKTQDKDITQLKQIREYLVKATQGAPSENYYHYTIKLLVDSGQLFNYDKVLSILEAVSAIALKNKEFKADLVHDLFVAHQIPVQFKVAEILNQENKFIQAELIGLMVVLQLGPRPNPEDKEAFAVFMEKAKPIATELIALDMVQLQARLQQTLGTCSIEIRKQVAALLKKCLKTLLEKEISRAFYNYATSQGNIQSWMQFIAQLKDLQDYVDFESLDKVVGKIKPIALLYGAMIKNPHVLKNEAAFLEAFKRIQFKKWQSEQLYYVFDFFSKMPQRNYLPLLEAIVKNEKLIYQKASLQILLRLLDKLNTAQFSTEAMIGFCKLFDELPPQNEVQYNELVAQLIKNFTANNKDPLVELLLTSSAFSLKQIMVISAQTKDFNVNRERFADFYKELNRQRTLDTFLNLNLDAAKKSFILNILALGHSGRRKADPETDFIKVAQQLQDLKLDDLQALSKQYESTLISVTCLSNTLNSLDKNAPFKDFLQHIERSPFGLRNLKEQFSTEEVERVVNQSLDLLNNTPYPYQYRKQLMEVFLLVNDLGQTLPVHNGKPAKELSNLEIKELFALLKNKNGVYIHTQKRVLALTLMREAMYRSTGQFPFSTQMIGLIDCMLHQGDVISNIDTGQGKSLIDVMKAAFLWLESDRVEVCTSSLFDAARDIENYSPFLSLLDIPFAKKPIAANTPLENISPNGVNFSTISQLGLRFSKAMANGENLNKSNQSISLVLNESDYAVLDDRSTKRLASSSELNIAKKNPWVYETINEFVNSETFKKDDTSAKEDVSRLRRLLLAQGRLLGKKGTFLNQIDDEALKTWIESAILVNFNLRENFDYVLVPASDKEGKLVAKILMSDSRPSLDSVFGKGIQQLLHAKLNKDHRFKKAPGEETLFEITAENRTIISSDNRSLINYYRTNKGYIWGSSGTVGSTKEIEEQYTKYGFAFSKIEPHQQKKVKESPLVLLKDKETQYQFVADQLKDQRASGKNIPTLIFCESIDKAKAIHALMVERLGAEKIQLNIGTNETEAEKALIKNAAAPGMCTITTAAIGRNTDIPYDKKVGLDIWFMDVASTRLDLQKLGRTGRQGSPGTIAYFLNEKDQNIKSKADILALREQLDALGRKERDYQEALYRIIGFYLAQLEKIPSAEFTRQSKRDFIHNKWSRFSEDLEQNYRELVLKKAFDEAQFTKEAGEKFGKLLQEAAPNYDVGKLVLKNTALVKPTTYNPYKTKILIKDCTPPWDIIYQLFHERLNFPQKKPEEAQEKELLQDLKDLFSSQNQPAHHIRFFNKVFESQLAKASLRSLYQRFLSDFLNKDKPSWFFTRWLGFNTPLNNIADNSNYLLLFRAIASLDKNKPIIEVDDIKGMAIAMLEEYLQNSWWISKEKRESAIALQNNIKDSSDIDAIIRQICDTQIAVAEKDIAQNKNYFGDSRLQNTLSRILTMTTALGVKTDTSNLITQISKRLDDLTQEEPGQLPTIDRAKNKVASMEGNARVLAKSLEKALGVNQQRYTQIPGMEGRDNEDPKVKEAGK